MVASGEGSKCDCRLRSVLVGFATLLLLAKPTVLVACEMALLICYRAPHTLNNHNHLDSERSGLCWICTEVRDPCRFVEHGMVAAHVGVVQVVAAVQ